MHNLKNKTKKWKRFNKEDDLQHWLGQGSLGQESLFLELCPYLYILDQSIYKLAYQVASQHEIRGDKPVALIVSAQDTIGWQIGYISKLFDIYLCSSPDTPGLYEAANKFGGIVSSFDNVNEQADFYLHIDSKWENENDFLLTAKASFRKSINGAFVLKCFGTENELEICWEDGSKTPLSEFLEPSGFFGFPRPDYVLSRCLKDIALKENYGVSAFLKRNKAYFGKNARDYCFDRINDNDFRESFSDDLASCRWATLMFFTIEL
jgi:hypothetical protein